MSRILLTPFALFLAVPALAHDGAHLHPHAANSSAVTMALLALVSGGVALLAWVRR